MEWNHLLLASALLDTLKHQWLLKLVFPCPRPSCICTFFTPWRPSQIIIALLISFRIQYINFYGFRLIFPSCFLFTGPYKVPMPPKDPSCVYVGRPSDWGNPFTVKQYGRRVAIEKFETYLLESDLINRINELRGKRLFCHCFPQECHASVLMKYAHELRIDPYTL